jgi:hypothetical protein
MDIRLAKEAGAAVVRTACLSGRRYETFDSAEAFRDFSQKSRRSLTLAAPVVKKYGVRLAVENHKDWRVPEMLDWLATEFVRQGWSIKSMHRLMMTSSTYRQGSVLTPALEKADPDNKLLSRMPMQRMQAEVLYDTMLLISSKLDESRFGQPEPVVIRDDGLVTPVGTEKGWHRGIYVEQLRTKLPTVMESFDLPSMSPNCMERSISMIAPQALNMMNDGMIANLAQAFAARVLARAYGWTEPEILALSPERRAVPT